GNAPTCCLKCQHEEEKPAPAGAEGLVLRYLWQVIADLARHCLPQHEGTGKAGETRNPRTSFTLKPRLTLPPRRPTITAETAAADPGAAPEGVGFTRNADLSVLHVAR